jgi:chromosome segregation ATPase
MEQYTDAEIDAMCLKAELDELSEQYETLRLKYEELQVLFVETDDELNHYRDKFIDEALQHNYLKNDYEQLQEDYLRAQNYALELAREIDGLNG